MVESVGRIFVATGFPSEVRAAIEDRLATVSLPGRRVDPADWHITLRFLGDIAVVAFERLLAALDECRLPPPFELRLGGVGAFPQARKAAVVWVGLEEGTARLRGLQEEVEQACEGVGLGREERPFRPHVTLSRIRPPSDVRRLVDQFPPLGIRSPVGEVVVLRSRLQPDGPRYEPLERFAMDRSG